MSGAEHSGGGSKHEAQAAACLVTVAGSAGALRAVQQLLSLLSPGFRGAVVVALHSGANSRLAEVLRFRSQLPVSGAKTGDSLRPGRVLVAPGMSHLVVNPDARVTVVTSPGSRRYRPSADWLFETGAASYGRHHIAVVLSGLLADGSTQLPVVKAAGGRVLVQHPRDCQYPDMCDAAIATGCADAVLPIASMPERLAAWLDESHVSLDYSNWEIPLGFQQ